MQATYLLSLQVSRFLFKVIQLKYFLNSDVTSMMLFSFTINAFGNP